jgi:hypothetical protein
MSKHAKKSTDLQLLHSPESIPTDVPLPMLAALEKVEFRGHVRDPAGALPLCQTLRPSKPNSGEHKVACDSGSAV